MSSDSYVDSGYWDNGYVEIDAAASMVAEASATGSPSQIINLSGDAQAGSHTAGTAQLISELSGITSAEASATGAVEQHIALSGIAQAIANSTGDMRRLFDLIGLRNVRIIRADKRIVCIAADKRDFSIIAGRRISCIVTDKRDCSIIADRRNYTVD